MSKNRGSYQIRRFFLILGKSPYQGMQRKINLYEILNEVLILLQTCGKLNKSDEEESNLWKK